MATERPAKAKRILVVEDEPMIRMLLEDMLSELGYTVAAEAAGIEEALEATKNADFDLAILDADLKGRPALPVADALVYPRHAVRFCHGLWRGARALSGPADADEAVPNGWAEANAAERVRVAVSQ
jgi:DNA-binding LytR/AlgR family response regulator